MLRRVAQDVFWVGRYLERADCLARFLSAQRRLALEVGRLERVPTDLLRRVSIVMGETMAGAAGPREAAADSVLDFAVLSSEAANSIWRCLSRALDNARSGRAYLSRESYESLNRLYLMLREMAPGTVEWAFALRRIELFCRVISGYLADTVVRDDAWQAIHAGRRLERALQTVRMLQAEAPADATPAWPSDVPVDPLAWGGLLRACGAYEAYRKVYRGPIEPTTVLELLLLYQTFPRSLRGSLALLRENLEALRLIQPEAWRPGSLDVRFNRLYHGTIHAHIDQVLRDGLVAFLGRVHAELAAIGEAFEDVFMDAAQAPPGADAEAQQNPQA